MNPDEVRSRCARHAIEFSATPLLCGAPHRVRQAARYLKRSYGISSYAMIPKGLQSHRLWDLRFPLPYLRRLPVGFDSPELLADLAIRFFAKASPIAVPVLIDCDGIFREDAELSAQLSAHAFLICGDRIAESPPFCYTAQPSERNSHA